MVTLQTGSPRPDFPTATGLVPALQETDPGASDRGADNPGSTSSGTRGPAAVRPEATIRVTTGPAAAPLRVADSETTGPAAAFPRTTDPGMIGLRTSCPETAGPASAPPGTTGSEGTGPAAQHLGTTGLAEVHPELANSGMTGRERAVRRPGSGVLVWTRRLPAGLPEAALPGPWGRARAAPERAAPVRMALARTALSQTGPPRAVASAPGYRPQARRALEVGQRLPRTVPDQLTASAAATVRCRLWTAKRAGPGKDDRPRVSVRREAWAAWVRGRFWPGSLGPRTKLEPVPTTGDLSLGLPGRSAVRPLGRS